MKPTREELERWAGGEGCLGFTLAMLKADRAAAARLALDLMDENESLLGERMTAWAELGGPLVPGESLADAIKRTIDAKKVRIIDATSSRLLDKIDRARKRLMIHTDDECVPRDSALRILNEDAEPMPDPMRSHPPAPSPCVCSRAPGVGSCGSPHVDGWLCTRDHGHAGEHVACGAEHRIAAWSDTPAPAPSPLLDDRVWRRKWAGDFMAALLANPRRYDYIAEKVESGELSQDAATSKNTSKAARMADALLAELRKRDGEK